MVKSITDLLSALSNIDWNYINVMGLNVANTEYQQAAEGAFTAELYYQYKTIITNDKTQYYSNLSLHYDLTKERFEGKRPDLVLHRSPSSRDDQRLYIEVKTSRTTQNYENDFKKLFLAVDNNNHANKLGYENAVFVTVKSDFKEVKKEILEYINNENLSRSPSLNKLYNIHLNENRNINILRFSEII